jgi:hypothetical protein
MGFLLQNYCPSSFFRTFYLQATNGKAKDLFEMGISEAKFMRMKPYSSHFIVALLPM